MNNDPVSGDFVKHAKLGLGKVLSTDGIMVRIYFKDSNEPNPDNRVRLFKAPFPYLTIVNSFPDTELDNLPPWKDERFVREKTTLSLDRSKIIFSRFFKGLDDPDFIKKELQYKMSAHDRYQTLFADQARLLIERNDHDSIARCLDAIYGDPKARKEGLDERLNLLDHKYEAPPYFDALRAGGEHTTRFAEAALNFVESGNKESFDRYLTALCALPTRKNGASIELWTTFTWLPFIAAPDRHFLVKPTIVQEFASILPFDIHYKKGEINYRTYTKCVDMARRIGDILAESELNLRKRTLDMIDVQSFMWVVERYQKEAGANASSA